MKPGSSDRCIERLSRFEEDGRVRRFRCRRHAGHADKHQAPSGTETVRWGL
jgi:hypothetical protein